MRMYALRVIAFLVTFAALCVIPSGVATGLLPDGWMLVSTVVIYLILAMMAAGAVYWIWMRVTGKRDRAGVGN